MFRALLIGMLVLAPLAAHAQTIPAANQVTVADAERIIGEKLAATGAGERIRATVIGAKSPTLYESASPLAISASAVQFDKVTGRWTGNILISSGTQVLTAIPAAGRFEEMVLIPVVKRPMRNGDVITAEDIDQLDYPLARTRSDVVRDPGALLGQSARASISPNRPIRAMELAQPTLLKKNAIVQLRYKTAHIEIATSGQALDNGAKGDIISIRNLNSKQIVRAVVEDASTASVLPFVQTGALGVSHAAPL